MKVIIPLASKENKIQEIKEQWKCTQITGCGQITFALVNIDYCTNWSIVEYKTGRVILHDIGKLSKQRFERLSKLIINMNPQRIKNAIENNEIINEA